MRNGRFLFGLAVPVLLGGGKTVDPCQPGWRSWELGSCDPDLRIFLPSGRGAGLAPAYGNRCSVQNNQARSETGNGDSELKRFEAGGRRRRQRFLPDQRKCVIHQEWQCLGRRKSRHDVMLSTALSELHHKHTTQLGPSRVQRSLRFRDRIVSSLPFTLNTSCCAIKSACSDSEIWRCPEVPTIDTCIARKYLTQASLLGYSGQ